MWKLIKRLWSGKSLSDHLEEAAIIRVSGIHFRIKKLNVLDHLNGSQILTESYKLWGKSTDPVAISNAAEKMKKHYRDVFMACVLDPVLVRKEEEAVEGKIHVDKLFIDFDLAHELYEKIMLFTYGKKKIKASLKLSR